MGVRCCCCGFVVACLISGDENLAFALYVLGKKGNGGYCTILYMYAFIELVGREPLFAFTGRARLGNLS